jgi:hypothetical protein
MFSGVGSLASERFAHRRDRALGWLAGGLTLLVLFYLFGLGPIVDRCVGWPLGARIALAAVFLAPLGLCLGAFMPLGLRTVAHVTRHREEFVAWSWAVNGFCSVVSTVLATILAMAWGFSLVMLAALAVYLVGVATLSRIPGVEGA